MWASCKYEVSGTKSDQAGCLLRTSNFVLARILPVYLSAELRPAWNHLLYCFGPGRLMWGSDWPVLNLASDYATWIGVADSLIGELAPDEQAQVWHGTAARFYGLDAMPA